MDAPPASTTRPHRSALLGLNLAAAGFAVAGLAAMALLSPRVLYADPWRFAAHFLSSPWPWNVLAADNGHREILPNLVRVAEMYWFGGNQWLQIVTGMLLASATAGVWLYAVGKGPGSLAARTAARFFAVAGIFWLGNERSLAHGNESVHVYLVTLCLVTGTWLLSRPSEHPGRSVAAAALLGVLATFSFGSGIACFVGFAMALLLRRAPWQHLAWVAGTATACAALHLGLGDGTGGAVLHWAPWEQLTNVLRWLAAPFLYLAWPLLDPLVAEQIPLAAVRAPCVAIAQTLHAWLGPPMTARWSALLGLAGVIWLLTAGLRVRDRADAAPAERMGVAVAGFALAVGVLVATARMDYFLQHPQQLVAPRYLPWSSLFWAGLALSAVYRERRPWPLSVGSVRWAMLAAALLLPSQFWMALLAQRAQAIAEATATAAAVSIVDAGAELGETDPRDLIAALPLLRSAQVSMFAWPETQALGRPIAGEQTLAVAGLDSHRIENLLPGSAYRVEFTLGPVAPCPRLALADGNGRIAGIAIRRHGDAWQGWSSAPIVQTVALCLQARRADRN